MTIVPQFLRLSVAMVLIGLIAAPSAGANERLSIGGLSVDRGSLQSGAIEVAAGADGIRTEIPVTVINGQENGPVLAVMAGVHGAEYAPILALQRLPRQLDPGELSGALVIVHIANLPAFQRRTIYVGPHDLKNLNRSFPGDPAGTVTERIASTLTEQVFRQADYLIDVHAGDANESLRPSYSAYYAEAGGDDVIDASHRIARAFGLETIVRFRGPIDSPEKAIYTSAQAVSLGIPAMDVESGERGLTDEQYLQPIVEGVHNVMRELDMIPGALVLPENPVYINERARIYSDHDGIWYPSDRVRAGDYVGEGTLLGRVTDYHGAPLADIRAPASGILLILFHTPPVNEGDNLVVIGQVD